jgi:dTDP-4-dehydrorhamnose 3,5-epimerase-like enzyme
MIEVSALPKVAEDERGPTHYFDTDRSTQFVCGFRKAGSVSARHYHKGLSVGKNPEVLVLFQGEITINWFDVRNPEIKGSQKVSAPALVTVYPYAWHEVLADTDMIFLEQNTLEDGRSDTFWLAETGAQ